MEGKLKKKISGKALIIMPVLVSICLLFFEVLPCRTSTAIATDRVAFSSTGSTGATVEWVQRYNSPENGHDSARAITIDSMGNVYVSGNSSIPGNVVTTIKYDTYGNQLWARRYDGPGSSSEYACAIAVDSSENVYLSGFSLGSTYEVSFLTIKYDTNGVRQWVRRYSGPGKGNDVPSGMAIDSLGNVYVTGSSQGSTADKDYATIKYDTNGVRQWVRRYNGPGKGDDISSAMAVDSLGNVYVSGSSQGSAGKDYTTIKYDTNGIKQWVRRYNNPEGMLNAMAVDTLGNVYVTGSLPGERNVDYVTIKYDANGVRQWVQRYNGPENGDDYVDAMAVDVLGNVYVTGYSYGSTTGVDCVTIKYDANGNQQWEHRYDGPGNGDDAADAMTIDSAGNVYVTGGSIGNGTGYDYVTIKFCNYSASVMNDSDAGTPCFLSCRQISDL